MEVLLHSTQLGRWEENSDADKRTTIIMSLNRGTSLNAADPLVSRALVYQNSIGVSPRTFMKKWDRGRRNEHSVGVFLITLT